MSPLVWDTQTLVLQQSGPWTARGTLTCASGQAESVTITRFDAGCGLRARRPVPVEVPREGVELEFELDLDRGRSTLERMTLGAVLDDGRRSRVYIKLDTPEYPVEAFPSVIIADTDACNVRIECRSARADRIEFVRVPVCVELMDHKWTSQGADLVVVPTGWVRRRHQCHSVLATVHCSGSPAFTLVLPVTHETRVTDDEGAIEIGGAFIPGEVVALCTEAGGAPRLLFKDRIPCAQDSLVRAGWRQLAEARVPSTGAAYFDWRLPGSLHQPAYRIKGRMLPTLASYLARWVESCP